jgi:hypothetical protein
MNTTQIQQGDILLEKADTLPTGCKIVKRSQNGAILAESAATNNRHFILDRSVKLFEAMNGDRYVVNEGDGDADLIHSKDHEPIKIAPGAHKVSHVQEIDHLTGMTSAVED